MRILWFILLFSLAGCSSPDEAADTAPLQPPTISVDTIVPAQAPTQPTDPITPPEEPNGVTLKEVIDIFGIDDPTGITFRNCYFTQLPFPKRHWDRETITTRNTRLIYAPGSRNTLEYKDDLLFVYQIHPGEYLIAEEYDEFHHYVELTIVDTLLNVLWGPEDVNCQDGEYGEGIITSTFTTSKTLGTLQEDVLSFQQGDTVVYRRYLRTETFLPKGETEEQVKSMTYFRRTIEEIIEPTAQVPEGGIVMGKELPWPKDTILPPNSIGILFLQEEKKTPIVLRYVFRFLITNCYNGFFSGLRRG